MSINEFIELEEEGRSITSWIFIFTALICVISFIISKFNSFKLKLRYKNLPPYEEGLIPYFGHLFSFARHPLQHATSLYEKVCLLFLFYFILFYLLITFKLKFLNILNIFIRSY